MANSYDNDSGYGDSTVLDITNPDVSEQKSKKSTSNLQLPDGISFLDSQLAGHCFDFEKNKMGMLRGPNGRVFKPINKPVLGEREIEFYENLKLSCSPTDIKFQRYTPAFYGTREMRIFDKRVKFLELEDITHGMSEPCVMDVKIGRRTWDPLATAEKRASEETKYAESKQTYGFCIPGFQVYRLPNDTLKKFDRNYGKKLNSKTVVEALEMFLNAGPNRPPCRELVIKLLSILWKILALFREQRRYHIYSSSLLIAYDAKRLRHYTQRQLNNSFVESLLRAPVSRSKTFTGTARSLGSLNRLDKIAASPSPLCSPNVKQENFVYPRPGSPKLDKSQKSGSGSLLTLQRPGSPKFDSPTRSPTINRTINRLQILKRSISLQNCDSLPQEKANVETFKQSLSMEEESKPRRVPEIHKLCRTHSYSNNFDADIIQMKEDYAVLLSELSSSCEEKQNWVRVYMIDFAHVFPAEDGQLDTNYLEGIESLIKLLEKFLA